MDDWRSRLTESLLGNPGKTETKPDPVAALEIVLGQARTEITYILELGKAHNLPTTGNVNGDDVWLRVGATSLRFHFSRRAGVIVASVVGREDQQLKYSVEKRGVVGPDGELLDTARYIREAIDATVNAWKASGRPDVHIQMLKSDRPPMPTLPDTGDIIIPKG